jgi:hypothetical protein
MPGRCGAGLSIPEAFCSAALRFAPRSTSSTDRWRYRTIDPGNGADLDFGAARRDSEVWTGADDRAASVGLDGEELDMDRAHDPYEALGWRLDADLVGDAVPRD